MGFEPMTSQFTGAMLYQLSYEATDVGSRSLVGSYVPVKEMSINIHTYVPVHHQEKQVWELIK